MKTIVTSYQVITFFADGRHINTIEVFDTAQEAIKRAEAWIALGHLAKAMIVMVDSVHHEINTYPLT